MIIEDSNNLSTAIVNNQQIHNLHQQYIQMSNLSSGGSSTTANSNGILNNMSRSSFRSSLKTTDFKSSNINNGQENNNNNIESDANSSAAVYNFPWDFKLKSNPLLVQITSNHQTSFSSGSSSSPSSCSTMSNVPPPLPSVPPPSTPKLQHDTIVVPNENTLSTQQDETQYCAPWDLKLQEEMLKLMAQQQTGSSNSTSSSSLKKLSQNEEKLSSNSFKRNDSSNSSIKSKISSNDHTTTLSSSTSATVNNNNSSTTDVEGSEYSPPWEHKQSVLFQQIASSNSKMPAPLATSSASSTLTTQASSTCTTTTTATTNNQANAMSALFNKLSLTRLSTRSNTSSSSSTRSSTSSLSASSPPSMAPPPLPPPMLPPPPPPPPSTATLPTNQSSSSSLHSCIDQSNQSKCANHRCVHQQNQQSPHLSHRHLPQTNTSSSSLLSSNQPQQSTNCGFIHVQQINPNSSNNIIVNNATLLNPANMITCTNPTLTSNYLNDPKKFCTPWSQPNNNQSFDTLSTAVSGSGFDDTKQIIRQNRAGSSHSHHFPFPHQQQFQTISSGDIQVSALPVTTLVFSQTNSLPTNILPINIQQQQPSVGQMSSPSHFTDLDRQPWFHGRITRKHAENMLNNRPIGSFLVRQSESGNSNDYSLSLVSGSGCVHMRICMKNGEFILGQCSQPFSSIIKMIDHYGRVEVPIKGAQHVKLSLPISPSG